MIREFCVTLCLIYIFVLVYAAAQPTQLSQVINLTSEVSAVLFTVIVIVVVAEKTLLIVCGVV